MTLLVVVGGVTALLLAGGFFSFCSGDCAK